MTSTTYDGDIAQELIRFVRDTYKSENFIPLHAPHFLGNEKNKVTEAIENGFVSSVGQSVTDFEDHVRRYTGARYCIATVNGTAALHVALRVVGIEPGDEVITQSLTFVATCNAVRYCGAYPTFVDIDPRTGGMSVDSLEGFLAEKTDYNHEGHLINRSTGRRIKACVPMHNIGHPVDIGHVQAICEKYGLELVEDAAESLGSFFQGAHTGRFGKMGIFSFNGNKIITTGGGGAIITDDEAAAVKARHLATTAKRPHTYLYIHDDLGYNYRMPALNAALGCAQMEMLPQYIDNKRRLADYYAEFFEAKGYAFVREPSGSRSNYWFNSFLARNRSERDHVLEVTNKNGVMTRPAWTPMHTLDLYKGCSRANLDNTEWLEDHLVSVPSSVVTHWLKDS